MPDDAPIDLKGLQTLAAIAERGSLTAASVALGVTQQAVSARTRALELRTGTALVRRSAQGSTLTDAGVLVAGWASEVLAAAARFEVAVDSLRESGSAQLTVSASLTVAEYLLPDWLVALRRADRQLQAIDVSVANSAAVIDLVRNGASEIGFIETPDVPADLDSLTVARDELVVVVGARHPWASRRRPITAAELARTPLIVREVGSGTRRALELALGALDPPLAPSPPASVLPTTTTIRSTVATGTAPAVLSALAIRDDTALKRLVPVRVSGLSLIRPLSAIWSKSVTGLSPAGQHLLRLAVEGR